MKAWFFLAVVAGVANVLFADGRLLIKSNIFEAPVEVEGFGFVRFANGLRIGSGSVRFRPAGEQKWVTLSASSKSEVVFVLDRDRVSTVECLKDKVAVRNLTDQSIHVISNRIKKLKPGGVFYLNSGDRFKVKVGEDQIFKARAPYSKCVLGVFGTRTSFYDVRFY